MKQIIRYAILKPEKLKFYKDVHYQTWPHVKQILAQCKIREYDLYFHGNLVISRLLYDGMDFQADTKILDIDPEYQQWTEITEPCFAKEKESDPAWNDAEHICIF